MTELAGNRLSKAQILDVARELYQAGPWMLRKIQQLRPHICPFDVIVPHIQPGSTVLDVGCGSGLFLGLAAVFAHPIRGVGFDSSLAAIRVAREMASRLRSRVLDCELDFQHRSVDGAWPEGPFDIVSLIDVLHHIPPAGQCRVFEMSAQRVRPGGLLIYKDMSNRSLVYGLLNALHDLVLARQRIHYVPLSSVQDWSRELGLRVMERQALLRYWYDHDLLILQKPVQF